jgi:peroxiredoxin
MPSEQKSGRTDVPRVEMQAPAPDFELVDFAGAGFRLAEQRGRCNVLVVFNRGFT